MVLLLGFIYAWAVLLKVLLQDQTEAVDDAYNSRLYEYWGTVPKCMMTLLGNGLFGDSISAVFRELSPHPPAFISLLFFVMVSTMCVLNMLLAVLCEVLSNIAAAEKDAIALETLKSTLLMMLKRFDGDGRGAITQDELMQVMEDDISLDILEDMDINVNFFLAMLEMKFANSPQVHISDIMNALLQNQGSKTANVGDLCRFFAFSLWKAEEHYADLKEDLESIHRRIQAPKVQINTQPSTSTVDCTVQSV